MSVNDAASGSPDPGSPSVIGRGRVAVVTGAIRDEAEQASAERFNQLSALGASPAYVAGMVVDGIRAEPPARTPGVRGVVPRGTAVLRG